MYVYIYIYIYVSLKWDTFSKASFWVSMLNLWGVTFFFRHLMFMYFDADNSHLFEAQK